MKKLKKVLKKPWKNYPLIALQTRNQYQPDKSLSHPILEHILLDLQVINANPLYLYRIAFLGIGELNGNHVEVTLQVDAIKKYDHETSAYREYLGERKFKIKVNKGIQKLKLQLEGDQASGLSFKIYLNSDKILGYVNSFFAAWRTQHKFYCWVIDPSCYHYCKNSNSQIVLPNTIGEKQSRYSNQYYLDPVEEFNCMSIGSRTTPHGIILAPIFAQTYFEFSSLSHCSNSILSYPYSKHGFSLLMNKIMTTTQHSAIAWPLFQANSTQLGGIHTFNSTLSLPLQALLSGHIEFLVRVSDAHSKEHYQLLLLTEQHQHPFNSSNKEYLGICHAVQQAQPRQLKAQDLHRSGYYSEKIYEQWLSGWWQHVRIPVHQLVDFHPQLSYEFFLQRRWSQGEKIKPELIRAEDLIILSGQVTFHHDLSPLISSQEYQHLLAGHQHDL